MQPQFSAPPFAPAISLAGASTATQPEASAPMAPERTGRPRLARITLAPPRSVPTTTRGLPGGPPAIPVVLTKGNGLDPNTPPDPRLSSSSRNTLFAGGQSTTLKTGPRANMATIRRLLWAALAISAAFLLAGVFSGPIMAIVHREKPVDPVVAAALPSYVGMVKRIGEKNPVAMLLVQSRLHSLSALPMAELEKVPDACRQAIADTALLEHGLPKGSHIELGRNSIRLVLADDKVVTYPLDWFKGQFPQLLRVR